MGNEASKSVPRRLLDPAFADTYFVGDGIDIGAGSDCIERHRDAFPQMGTVRRWDVEDGDAMFMASVPNNAVAWVHSSHCLEHLLNPQVALSHWLRIVTPGGYVVVLVPDEDMYEQGLWPPAFNPDHRWTFTCYKARSWSPRTVNLLAILMSLGSDVELIKLESLQHTFDWSMPRGDQTGGIGEAAIEIILRKRPWAEVEQGGRVGAARFG